MTTSTNCCDAAGRGHSLGATVPRADLSRTGNLHLIAILRHDEPWSASVCHADPAGTGCGGCRHSRTPEWVGWRRVTRVGSNPEPGARPEGRRIGAVSEANWRELKEVADREGFEPPIPLQVCRISSAVHSTTLPPVRGRLRLKRAGYYTRQPADTSLPIVINRARTASSGLTSGGHATIEPCPARGNPRPISFGMIAPRVSRLMPARATRPRNRLPKSRPACAPSGAMTGRG